ncbi:LAME_0F12156g1_1 [Lachancea meyersii CBS 8951]|uniref:LAME_0F12156g1_1 n=1 Tax=Lachancea meyersii CBS 8951 TaxID=1266667 RepID=A0A1G4JWI4_9SACH|nr:LAME_0F12156g1_1 [Lachancea meyersii CBS 8951]
MDFKHILHQLQPLLNDGTLAKTCEDQDVARHYVSSLSELAVSLRAPANRDTIRDSGVLERFLDLLNTTLDQKSIATGVIAVLSELVRCLANCLADNGPNRSVFMSQCVLKTGLENCQLPRLLNPEIAADNDLASSLRLRSLALIKNLCLDNETYAQDCSKILTTALFQMLRSSRLDSAHEDEIDSIAMASDLLFEFTKFSHNKVRAVEIQILVQLLRCVAPKAGTNAPSKDESDQEDPYGEICQLLAGTLETIVLRNETIDFSDSAATHKLQKALLESLATLELKANLENKLIIMRRLVSVVGLISANKSNSNLQDQDMCYEVLQRTDGGYTAAAALIVLSNSVSSRQVADKICDNISLGSLIKACQNFRDPVQFQGFLDLTKKLLNLSNVHDLQEPDLALLFSELKICHDQCQYFQGLSPLVDAFLDKLIALLPGSVLRKLLAHENFKSVIIERGGIASALLLDKLVLQKNGRDDKILADLWTSVFRLHDSSVTQSQGVSTPFLFQLMKSLGIYLRSLNTQDPNLVFESHSQQLSMLLDTIAPLVTKTDSASRSIHNNGRFVAGMIVNLLKDKIMTPEEAKLLESATKLLMDS